MTATDHLLPMTTATRPEDAALIATQDEQRRVAVIRLCRRTRAIVAVGLAACVPIQLIIDASLPNTMSVAVAAISGALAFYLTLRERLIRLAPLPTLVVAGNNMATLSGPLLAQTFSARALVFNLKVPELTFDLCAVFQGALIIALYIFVYSAFFRGVSRVIAQTLVTRLGLLRAPDEGALWLMGFIGSAAQAWSASKRFTGEIEYGDVSSKLILGLTFLAYAPFLIPLRPLLFREASAVKIGTSKVAMLTGYFAVIGILGVAGNTRSVIASGIANLVMSILVAIYIGQIRISAKIKRRVLVAAVCIVAVAPQLSNLAIAMVIVRSERGHIASSELIKKTFATFSDERALDAYRKNLELAVHFKEGYGEYDEVYLNNPFLARFIATKFFDNTLSLPNVTSGRASAVVEKASEDKLLGFLPTPVLKTLGITLDKNDLDYSMGDYLYYAQFGTGLGWHRVGSPIAHGLALFGYAVFFLVIPYFIASFTMISSFAIQRQGFITISPVLLLQMMNVYYMACGDSLLDPLTLALRALPQDVVIYALILFFVRFIPVRFR